MTRQSSHTALLWIVAVGFFMQALDTTIVNTALPSIAHSLNAQPLAMQSIVVAYTLTMALLTPASGWLADRFGTRRVYFVAILLFVVGSLCCAGAHTLNQLIVARVLQGIGGSMLLPIGRLAVLRSVTGEAYVSALAVISIAGQVGPILGPTLGGWFVESISWHWIFLINVPIGALGLVAVHRYLPNDAIADAPPFDFVGCGLLSLCMVAFSIALDSPVDDASRAGRGAVSSQLSAVAALAYIPHARRRRNPLFQLTLFREPNFSVGLIGNLRLPDRIERRAVPAAAPDAARTRLHPAAFRPHDAARRVRRHRREGLDRAARQALRLRRVPAREHAFWWARRSSALRCSRRARRSFVEIAILAVFGACNSMQFAAMNSVTLKGLSISDAGSGNSLFSMVQMLAIGLGVSIGGGLVQVFDGAVRLGGARVPAELRLRAASSRCVGAGVPSARRRAAAGAARGGGAGDADAGASAGSRRRRYAIGLGFIDP